MIRCGIYLSLHTSGLFEAKSKDDCPMDSFMFSSSECISVFIFCTWSPSIYHKNTITYNKLLLYIYKIWFISHNHYRHTLLGSRLKFLMYGSAPYFNRRAHISFAFIPGVTTAVCNAVFPLKFLLLTSILVCKNQQYIISFLI